MIKHFKFFDNNKVNIEDDPLYHLNVYENIALGLISYCYRMNLNPIGYQHQFNEGGLNRHLVINGIIRHDNFECRHVRISYEIYDNTGTSVYSFHLAEDVFNEVIRRIND